MLALAMPRDLHSHAKWTIAPADFDTHSTGTRFRPTLSLCCPRQKVVPSGPVKLGCSRAAVSVTSPGSHGGGSLCRMRTR
jgi:hypothetical protein